MSNNHHVIVLLFFLMYFLPYNKLILVIHFYFFLTLHNQLLKLSVSILNDISPLSISLQCSIPLITKLL